MQARGAKNSSDGRCRLAGGGLSTAQKAVKEIADNLNAGFAERPEIAFFPWNPESSAARRSRPPG